MAQMKTHSPDVVHGWSIVGSSGVAAVILHDLQNDNTHKSKALQTEVQFVHAIMDAGFFCIRLSLFWLDNSKHGCLLLAAQSFNESPLQQRVFGSDAMKQSYIMKLPPFQSGQPLVSNNKTILLENTSGSDCLKVICQSLDVFGSSSFGDARDANVCIVERDAGDGSVLGMIGKHISMPPES
eukprot:12332279-Karenia_brevis.AAC.1